MGINEHLNVCRDTSYRLFSYFAPFTKAGVPGRQSEQKLENRDDTLTTNNQTKQRRNCQARAAGSPSIHRLGRATDILPLHATTYRVVEYASRSIPNVLLAQKQPLAQACLHQLYTSCTPPTFMRWRQVHLVFYWSFQSVGSVFYMYICL